MRNYLNRTAIASVLMASVASEVAATGTTETPAPAKPKTVIEDMDSRRMFDSTDDAAAYLNQCAESYVDFGNHPQVLNGIISEGENAGDFDPAVYTPDMRVMVAVLANRGEKGKPSTVKAIVVTPAPKLDAILESESGKLWASKIIEKELNHVAVRALRTADDVETVADQMPLSLADYVTSTRESSGGIMETFNTLFKGLIQTLAARSPAFAKARLTKGELKKAFESKAYALEYYSKLEDRGDKPSLFVMALQLGQREAKNQGLDAAIFDKWLATRDEKTFAVKTDDEDGEDFDLESLAFVDTSADDAESDTATQTPAETATTAAE